MIWEKEKEKEKVMNVEKTARTYDGGWSRNDSVE